MSELGFVLEERAGTWVAVEDGGGVSVADWKHVQLWTALKARESEWDGITVRGLPARSNAVPEEDR